LSSGNRKWASRTSLKNKIITESATDSKVEAKSSISSAYKNKTGIAAGFATPYKLHIRTAGKYESLLNDTGVPQRKSR
jgi:hypothetical protein